MGILGTAIISLIIIWVLAINLRKSMIGYKKMMFPTAIFFTIVIVIIVIIRYSRL